MYVSTFAKAHVFDETFGVNSAFNSEVFVAAPHAVPMQFDPFGERRSSHWVKGGGSARGNFSLDSAVANRKNAGLSSFIPRPLCVNLRIISLNFRLPFERIGTP